MELLHNAPFSKRKALTALLTAPLWGLALVVALPVLGFAVTVYTAGERILRRKESVIDA